MATLLQDKGGFSNEFRNHSEAVSAGVRRRRRARIWTLCAVTLVALGFHVYRASFGELEERKGFNWDKIKPSSKLRWVPCEEKRECARFEVPMDYSDLSGEKVAIALTRLKAKVSPNSTEYRGPILFNPGGPGGSGVQLVARIGEELQRLLGEEYDIVGFDPRGIGRTTPQISVFHDDFDRAFWEHDTSLVNTSDGSLSKQFAHAWVTGQLATKKVNRTAQFVSTAMVARDMLSITQAHGREKLQYWGFSYGTVLGATFASMFPDKVERLIIDGVVEFSDYYTGRWYTNLLDTDSILKFWFDECAAAGPACPLHDDSSEVIRKRVFKILEGLREKPVPAIDGSNYGVVEYSPVKKHLFSTLYKPFATMANFTTALAALERGNGAPMLTLLKQTEFVPKCQKDPLVDVPTQEAGAAVLCGESKGEKQDYETISKHLEDLSHLSYFADVWVAATRMRCVGWDIVTKERFGGPFNTTTSFPLLIIGNTADPVTPLMAAKKAAAGFTNSALLTVNTPGHCSSAGTSPLASKYIREYFRNGTLPPEGTICEVEDKLFGPRRDLVTGLGLEDRTIVEAARAISAKANFGFFI